MKVLAIILAGGKGTRLEPLVRERCKPAVPFGGKFRIIDIVLSNCINSDIRRINVMVQYKSSSLQKHIAEGWSFLSPYLGEYVDVYPPQQRVGEQWYMGTADAVYQNLFTIEEEKPDLVLILSGDHIYKMDYREMIENHLANKAVLTVGTIPVPIEEGSRFGIVEVNDKQQIVEFYEKPEIPKPMPFNPELCLASMGIYIFNTGPLTEWLIKDAALQSDHDFGKNIIPTMIHKEPVYSFPFCYDDGVAKYWKDVGTIESFYQANMELLNNPHEFSLNDESWPFRTLQLQNAPSRIISANPNQVVNQCFISNGGFIAGDVHHSILGFNVTVGEGAVVEDSVLFNGVKIGEGAIVKNAIIDKGVEIPPYTNLSEVDVTQWGGKVTAEGITVIPTGIKVD